MDLSRRLALRPAEAAAALGVSVRKLRQLLPRIPHRREEGVVLISVEELQRWLREGAQTQLEEGDVVVREQLARVCGVK